MKGVLLGLCLAASSLTTTIAFVCMPATSASSSSRSPFSLSMGRDWFTDRIKISDEALKFVHEYIDSKGKNVVRGPATVKGPDSKTIEVLRDEEVEIIGGMVYRTYLKGFPPVNEARLRAEGKVMLEIRWNENWETEGFTLEVMGVTGPDCIEYTNRFCEATGCIQKGPMVVKPAYFEVSIGVTQNQQLDKLRAIQSGAATIEF